MDPVAPWSAYAASYNRLANAGGFQNATSSEIHHHMGGGVQTAPSTTSQLLAAHATSGLANSSASPFNPTGFLSPPPVGYDSVFTPLFHQKAHYGIQPRPIKQVESDPYNQMNHNNFYEQNNGPSIPWSQNSAQLPSPFGILPHESVVASSSGATPKTYENFNAHFAAAQSLNQLTDYKNGSFIDPKKRPLSPPKPSISAAAPFFQQMFTPPSEPNSHFKQNEYLSKNFQNGHQACSVSSPPNAGKEYRIPQPPRSQFPQQRNETKPRAFTPKQTAQKQPKMFDTEKRNDNESQSSPISYAMMDSQRGFQSTKMRSQQYEQIPNQQSYRFPMTPESDYQRSKSTESFGSTSSNPDCNIGIPRRASPIQPQPSPSIPAQSPVYPMYNSPLTTISSPSPVQHDSCYNKQQPEVTPPLDVTVPRNSASNSVITRIDGRYDRQDYSRQQWDERQRRYSGYDMQNIQSRQQYYDPGNQVTLQDLSSCRGDPMSLVKNLQQQQPEKQPVEEAPKKRKKSIDKHSESDYVTRVPPPAHLNANPANQNGFLDIERWNMNSTSAKSYSATPATYDSHSSTGDNLSNQPSSLVMPHSGPSMPYYSAFNLPQTETSEVEPESSEPVHNKPKVILLNIVEELQCLLDNVTEECLSKRPLGPNPNIGFMDSFKKFLEGEKETSPPCNKSPIQRLKIKIYPPRNVSNEVPNVPEFPSDPQDDPRYFPLPKSSDKRKFNSSDSEGSDDEIITDQVSEKKEETPTQEEHTHTNFEISNEPKKKKKKDKKNKKKKKKSRKRDPPEEVVPRREVSKRKAKEKSSYCLIDDNDAEHRIPELNGSDSDPPWNPEEGPDGSRLKRSRRLSTRIKTNFKESSDEEPQPERETRLVLKRRISISASKKPSEKSLKKPPPQIIYPSKASSKSNSFPFNIGEFVVLKTDTHLRHPPIWKVSEKNMLQKFLHFVDKGMSFYQNLRFFTGWSPENKNVYEGVIVKVISACKQDMVVELLSNDIHELDVKERSILNRIVKETSVYHENFEIYIQTLFSQALDANFLNEIFQEQDEYFLLNVQAIDNVVSDLERRLIENLEWPEDILLAAKTFLNYKGQQKGGKTCICGNSAIQLITLSGVPYNKNTLEFDLLGSPSTVEAILCRNCLTLLETIHSLCHFKHSLYGLCEVKVNERKEEDFEKDTTSILNEMLADEQWLKQLFDRVRRDWGYAEVLIQKLNDSSPTT